MNSRSILLAIIALSLSGCSASSLRRTESSVSLTGSWVGAATFRGAQLPTTIRFVHTAEGLGATISTPDAYQLDTPLRDVRYQHPNVHFEFEEAGERLIFEGKRDGETITGTVHGGELRAEFTLKQTNAEQAANYTQEGVSFRNDTIELNGTLLVPSKSGKHPAVVFIHGPVRALATTTAFMLIASRAVALLHSFTISAPLEEAGATTNNPIYMI